MSGEKQRWYRAERIGREMPKVAAAVLRLCYHLCCSCSAAIIAQVQTLGIQFGEL